MRLGNPAPTIIISLGNSRFLINSIQNFLSSKVLSEEELIVSRIPNRRGEIDFVSHEVVEA